MAEQRLRTGRSAEFADSAGGASNAIPLVTLVDPNDATLTWRNQQNSTVTPDVPRKSLVFLSPTAGNDQVMIYKQAVPGASYTIEIGFTVAFPFNIPYVGFGLIVNNNAGGDKFLGILSGVVSGIDGIKGTGLSTWSTQGQTQRPPVSHTADIFIKMVDDGTTFTFYISANGLDWILQYTEAHATFVGTPDEIGVVMLHDGFDMQARLFHYTVY